MHTPCHQITSTVGLEEMLKMCCWPVLLVCALHGVMLSAAFFPMCPPVPGEGFEVGM